MQQLKGGRGIHREEWKRKARFERGADVEIVWGIYLSLINNELINFKHFDDVPGAYTPPKNIW